MAFPLFIENDYILYLLLQQIFQCRQQLIIKNFGLNFIGDNLNLWQQSNHFQTEKYYLSVFQYHNRSTMDFIYAILYNNGFGYIHLSPITSCTKIIVLQ